MRETQNQLNNLLVQPISTQKRRAYGAMVAYLLIIKDTVPSIVGVDENDRLIKTLIMIATSATIMLPLSMQRDMASLSITSLFSVLADVVLVGFIVTYAPMSESVANAGGLARVIVMDSVKPTIFIGLGILSTAMACQHSAFIVSTNSYNYVTYCVVGCESRRNSRCFCLLLRHDTSW